MKIICYIKNILTGLIIVVATAITSCTKPPISCKHKNYLVKDSVIYVFDTVYIHHYIDTVYSAPDQSSNEENHLKKQKGILQLNPNNLGIGPSLGAYYSPFNGFDVLFGFGIQYFFTRIPIGRAKTRHPGFHRNTHHHK